MGPVKLLEVCDDSLGLKDTSDMFEVHLSELAPSDSCSEFLELEDGSSFVSDSVISIHSGASVLTTSVEFLFEDSLKLWIRRCSWSIF